jgi:uncharacterized protein involved in exopolysaccharide biosynthesis
LSAAQTLEALRGRFPLIAFCIVVVGLSAFVFSERESKQYTATAVLKFNGHPLTGRQIAVLATASSKPPEEQADEIPLVKAGAEAAPTLEGLDQSYRAQSVRISGGGEDNIVAISATAGTPAFAARVANAYAQQAGLHERRANQHSLKVSLAHVTRARKTLGADERFSQVATELGRHERTLLTLQHERWGNVTVSRQARVPVSPSAPKTAHDTIMGLTVGLLVGVSLVLLLALSEQTRVGTTRSLGDAGEGDACPACS